VITIYPNPSKNLIYIDSDNSSFTASIFNLKGEVVLTKNIKNQIDISDLNKVIYFAELMNESNKSFQKLIVKK